MEMPDDLFFPVLIPIAGLLAADLCDLQLQNDAGIHMLVIKLQGALGTIAVHDDLQCFHFPYKVSYDLDFTIANY